jgi:hypothetical protein
MAIEKTDEWWKGSEQADLREYLRAYSEDYPATVFREIVCPCGSTRFKLERALDTCRRICAVCKESRFICRTQEDWDEAIDEEKVEKLRCVAKCKSKEFNVTVGFSHYEEAGLQDAVKWYYIGERCVECGILGSFMDGKIGQGPAKEIYESA